MVDQPTGHEEELHRGLRQRHMQLIALGGAIGVGLFLGSGQAIQQAGPAVLVTYAVVGAVLFIIMRALGELLYYKPVAASFSQYAEEFLGRWAGYATAWTYWLFWTLICMAEVTASGIYIQHWFPDFPQWLTALIALSVLWAANLIAVAVFGEVEFWFSLLKIIVIIALIVVGIAIIVGGFGKLGDQASFSNLWDHGGFFSTGISGPFLALSAVLFSFAGIEIIGTAAGETQDPRRNIPPAVNKVFWRILIFYIGALLVIMSLLPWDNFSAGESPFVMVFAGIGIPAAASVLNIVVLSAALSSCNSGIFSTGRMLYTLARFERAPAIFRKLSRSRVPSVAITSSFLATLVVVALNYVAPAVAFTYLLTLVTTGAVFVWSIILIAHLRYRVQVRKGHVERSSYRLPGSPWTNWFALAFLAMVVVMIALDPDTRIALYVAPLWVAILAVGYFMHRRRTTLTPSAESTAAAAEVDTSQHVQESDHA